MTLVRIAFIGVILAASLAAQADNFLVTREGITFKIRFSSDLGINAAVYNEVEWFLKWQEPTFKWTKPEIAEYSWAHQTVIKFNGSLPGQNRGES
jgi:hypothetical protein